MRVELAHLPSSASATEKFPTWEQGLGRKLAGLCSVMTQMMLEREATGQVNPEMRAEGGELLIQLVQLKLYIKDDFGAIARKHAIEALTEHIAGPPEPQVPNEVAISSLVDHALKLVAGFIKEKLAN